MMMPCDEHDHKCLKVPNKLVKQLTMEVVERALDNFNSTEPLLLSRVGLDEKGKPFEEKKPARSGKSNQSINPMGCKKKCSTKQKGRPKKFKECIRKCNGNGNRKGKGNNNGKGKGMALSRTEQ